MTSGDPVVRGKLNFLKTLMGIALASVSSQMVPPVVLAQPAPPVPVANSDDASTKSADASLAEPTVHRLYVPADQLDAVLKRDGRGVLLSRDEFRKLWNAAKDAGSSKTIPSTAVVVSSAEYSGRIEEERLRLSAEIRFTQFESGWQVLRIPVGGLSIESVNLDEQPATAARDPENAEALLVFHRTPGKHRVTLELSAAMTPVGSDGMAEFDLPRAPTGTLELTLPEDKSLLVGGLSVGQSKSDGNASQYRLPIGGRTRISLRVTDGDAAQTVDKLLFAKTDYRLFAAPGEVTWSATTNLTVFGRTLDQLTFTVPTSLDVAAVESVGLASWDMNDAAGDDRTEITLTYRQPFSGSRDVTIRGMFVPGDDEWSVPTLLIRGTDSHVAHIAVTYDPAIRLQPAYDDSVRPVAVDQDEGAEAANRPQMAFQALTPDFDLSFFTPRKVGVMQVAMTNLLHLSDGGLDLATILDVQADVAPLFEIQLTLPAEFEMTAVTVAGQASNWTLANEEVGLIDVHIPLTQPLHPGESRRIDITAHAAPEDWPVVSDPVLIGFPQVGLPQADMIEARYGITATDDLEVVTIDLSGLDPAHGQEAAALRRLVESLGRDLRLGFTYQDSIFTGELEVSRRPPSFAVSTLSLSRLEPQRTVTMLRSTVTVEGGGLEGMLIQLPENVSDETRFALTSALTPRELSRIASEGTLPLVNIVEQTVSDAVNGQRTWALRFDRRLRGTHVLSALVTQPRSEGEPVTLDIPTFVGADRQSGWIAVEARDDQRLSVTATSAAGQPLRSVDPIDLPGMETDEPGARRIVAGFRFVRPDATATVTEELFSRAAVPTAVADRIDVRSIWGPTGQLQHRFDARFRAAGVQSLSLALPEDAELWAVEIDGQPIEVRQSLSGYQIPLPSTDSPEADRSLEVYYSTNTREQKDGGRLQQTEPQLLVQSGNGQIQPIDVLAHDWTLLYPHDVVLLESEGRFAPTTQLQDDTVTGRMLDLIRLPSAANLFWRIAITVAALAVLWLCLFAVRHSAGRVATVLGGILCVCVLIALLLPSVQQSREAARRTQLLNEMKQRELAAANEPLTEAPPSSEDAPWARSSGGGIGGGGFAGQADSPIGLRRQFDFQGGVIEEFQRNGNLNGQAPPPASADDFSIPQIAQQAPPSGLPSPAANRDGDGAQNAAEALGLPVQGVENLDGIHGALLSLTLDLDAPQGLREMPFRSVGTAADPETPALDVRFASRSNREVVAWIVAVGIMLAMWWLRATSIATRGIVAVLVVVVPLALLTVIPATRSMIVEGVLLGGMAGVLLWGVRWFVGVMCHTISIGTRAEPLKQPVAVGLIIVASLHSGVNHGSADETEPPDIPTIIVPYDNGDPLKSDRVLLPQELFDRLRSQAHPHELPVKPAPVDGVIADAQYTVDAGATAAESGERATLAVSARYTVYNFRDEPIVLLLPLKDVAVTRAKLNDAAATVRPIDDSGLELVVPETGQQTLELAFKVPAELRDNSGDLTLSLLPVAAGRLTVGLPEHNDWRVSVSRDEGAPIGFRRQKDDDGRLAIEIPIDRGGRIAVSWQPEESPGTRQGIVNVESTTAVKFEDAGVSLLAAYDIDVRQGAVSRVVFDFPESLRLKRLWGPDVGGWQLDEENGQRTLTVFLRRTVDDETRILADLFVTDTAAADDIAVNVPQFAPRDVTRESGQVILLGAEERDIRIGRTEGLTRTNSLDGELPEGLNPRSLPMRGTFRFNSRPWQLSLNVTLRPPQTRVTAEHGMYLGSRKVLLGTRLEFELAGSPRRLLRVLLPHDFLLVDLHSDEVTEWFVEAGELVLDLGQPRVGRVGVTFEGQIPRFPNDPEVVLETPLPQELERQESHLAVWVEDGLTATLNSFEGWRSIAPEQLSSELRALHKPPPKFAFRSSELEPELIIARVDQNQPQLVGDAVTLIAVSDTSVDYGLTLRWAIERASVEELTFTTPAWLEGRLEFTGESIRRTSSTFTDDDRIRWSVSLESPVRGQYLLSAIATLPPPEDGVVTAPDIRFEQAGSDEEFTDLSVQRSYAVLVNLSSSQLAPVDEDAQEKVLADNLPLTLRDELLVQAMDIVQAPGGGAVSWQMQTVTEQRTAAATVTSADLTTVLAADGSWRTEGEYRVRNRGHQYLAVRIPAEARLLSAIVKDRPARVLQTELNDKPVALVPLPQTSAADLSFVVRIVLQGTLRRALSRDVSLSGEQISLPVPTIVTQRQSPEYGVPVVSTNWMVSVPNDFEATIVTDGDATNVSQQGQDGGVMPYLQQLQELSDLNRLVSNRAISLSQRKRAAKNIRDLAAKIQKSADPYEQKMYGKTPLGITKEYSEIAQQRDELLGESLQNADQLEGAITNGFSEESPLDDSADGRQYITGNSVTIMRDNQFRGRTPAEKSPESDFRFGRASRESQMSRSKEQKTDDSLPRSRSMLKEQLSRQQDLESLPREAPIVNSPQSGLGGAGLGGGFAGGRALLRDEVQSLDGLNAGFDVGVVPSFANAGSGERSTGGLSLPINIPIDGHALKFSKLGGSPKLTLSFRPRESVTTGLKWLWTIVWIAVAALGLRLIFIGGTPADWKPLLVVGCVALGLFVLVLLPSPFAWGGLLLLVVGLWTGLRKAPAPASLREAA